MKTKSNNTKLNLPCLKGRIGDWYYYSSTMSFAEVANRVKLPKEINKKYEDPKLKLGEWIQRDIAVKRIEPIANYLSKQKERFFNSLVLGIYDGEPSWQEFEIKIDNTEKRKQLTEEELKHFSETFGILRLSGSESIFAIDGQHRVMGIRNAISNQLEKFIYDEVSVIFIAHKTEAAGNERTRRLFSTLNRYAKPVNKGEIIALSEDDNCAIITRKLIEEHKYLKDRVSINKNRSISQQNTNDFTSVIMLYDIVYRILTNKRIVGYDGAVKGKDEIEYTNTRITTNEINKDYKILESLFNQIFTEIPAFKSFFVDKKIVKRDQKNSSLLFKVIGQNIFFDVIKAAINEKKLDSAIQLFVTQNFSLTDPTWKTIFWDDEKQSLITDPANQKYAKFLFFDKLAIPSRKTDKDKIMQDSLNLTL